MCISLISGFGDVIFVFFFFQAEDGIRDKLVTGVQTCALPISARSGGAPGRLLHPPRCRASGARRDVLARTRRDARRGGRRSEERRVGKECRSRWSPYQ